MLAADGRLGSSLRSRLFDRPLQKLALADEPRIRACLKAECDIDVSAGDASANSVRV